MSSNIYIISARIRTGKTTRLMEWLEDKDDVAGILTPDIDGKRKLYDIARKTYFDLEIEDAPGKEIISVGRFCFDAQVFQKAREILLNAVSFDPAYLIIDEIGTLELEGLGLEPAVGKIIDDYLTGLTKGKLVLVIRDTLLENAMIQYGLKEAVVIVEKTIHI